jgi:hypothetical protein
MIAMKNIFILLLNALCSFSPRFCSALKAISCIHVRKYTEGKAQEFTFCCRHQSDSTPAIALWITTIKGLKFFLDTFATNYRLDLL